MGNHRQVPHSAVHDRVHDRVPPQVGHSPQDNAEYVLKAPTKKINPQPHIREKGYSNITQKKV